PRVTHPCATKSRSKPPDPVRLACVKRAASVRSEPGSNSPVDAGSFDCLIWLLLGTHLASTIWLSKIGNCTIFPTCSLYQIQPSFSTYVMFVIKQLHYNTSSM